LGNILRNDETSRLNRKNEAHAPVFTVAKPKMKLLQYKNQIEVIGIASSGTQQSDL